MKENIHCPICGLDLNLSELAEREQHVNECLNRKQESSCKSSTSFQCSICKEDLNFLNELERRQHVEFCLDTFHQEEPRNVHEEEEDLKLPTVYETNRDNAFYDAFYSCGDISQSRLKGSHSSILDDGNDFVTHNMRFKKHKKNHNNSASRKDVTEDEAFRIALILSATLAGTGTFRRRRRRYSHILETYYNDKTDKMILERRLYERVQAVLQFHQSSQTIKETATPASTTEEIQRNFHRYRRCYLWPLTKGHAMKDNYQSEWMKQLYIKLEKNV
jgi:hypothetical protein